MPPISSARGTIFWRSRRSGRLVQTLQLGRFVGARRWVDVLSRRQALLGLSLMAVPDATPQPGNQARLPVVRRDAILARSHFPAVGRLPVLSLSLARSLFLLHPPQLPYGFTLPPTSRCKIRSPRRDSHSFEDRKPRQCCAPSTLVDQVTRFLREHTFIDTAVTAILHFQRLCRQSHHQLGPHQALSPKHNHQQHLNQIRQSHIPRCSAPAFRSSSQ